MRELVRAGLVRSAAHITGGGLEENLPRALPEHLGAELDTSTWEIPPIFELLKREADLTEDEIRLCADTDTRIAHNPSAVASILGRCPVPTVFVTGAGNREVRDTLGAALPLLAADSHYAAYGPCAPHPVTPSPRRGEGDRG